MKDRSDAMSITTVHLILIDQLDDILMMERADGCYGAGQWSLPSGHLDKEENVLDALFREVKEEIGIDVSEMRVEMIHVMNRLTREGERRIDFFFKIKWNSLHMRIPQIMETDKCSKMAWYNIDSDVYKQLVYQSEVLQYIAVFFNLWTMEETFSIYDEKTGDIL